MLTAKPLLPGSGAAGAAAHIHGHRRWAALPTAASAELLLVEVEAKLRQQMQAEERPSPPTVPRISFLIFSSAGDDTALRWTLRALYGTTRPTPMG